MSDTHHPAAEPNQLRSYLLRTISESQRSDVETRLFTDPSATEDLEQAEDELVEAYLDGRLTNAEREYFEARYLDSPRHRARLDDARQLRALFSEPDARSVPPPSPWAVWRPVLGWAVAAGLLLAMVIGSYSYMRLEQRMAVANQKTDQLQAQLREREQELARRTPVTPPSTQPSTQPSTPPATPPSTTERRGLVAMSFTLMPGITRSADQLPELLVPRSVDIIRFQIRPRQERRSNAYRVRIESRAGVLAWQGSVTRAEGQPSLTVDVPASSLPAGTYILGVEPDVSRNDEAPEDFVFTIAPASP